MHFEQRTLTDAELLQAIKGPPRDRDRAVAYLFRNASLRNKAFSVMHKLLNDKGIAEDLFGESLVQFTLSVLREKFRGDSTISTYIVAICAVLAKRHLTRPPKHLEKELSVPRDQIEQIVSGYIDGPEEEYIHTESNDIIRKLLDRYQKQLPSSCEETLRWHHMEGIKAKVIADQEQVGEQAIKNRLSKCRQKLRQLLEQDSEAMNFIREKKWINRKK